MHPTQIEFDALAARVELLERKMAVFDTLMGWPPAGTVEPKPFDGTWNYPANDKTAGKPVGEGG